MQENIHPEYKKINVTCSCGNQFDTGSTYKKSDLHIEICAKCHPFYTGQQKMIDTAGRVDRFRQKYAPKPAAPKAAVATAPVAATKKAAKAVPAEKAKPKAKNKKEES